MWVFRITQNLARTDLAIFQCTVPTLIIVCIGLGRFSTDRHTQDHTTGASGSGGPRTVLGALRFKRAGMTNSAIDSIPGPDGEELQVRKVGEGALSV
jgi:hypothetical protein